MVALFEWRELSTSTVINTEESEEPSTTTTPIPLPRIKNHSATVVNDTDMYVFGGYDGQKNHNSLHRFHIPTNQWFLNLSCGSVKPQGRNGHTCSYFPPPVHSLVVIGGWLGSGPFAADDLNVFDLNQQTWDCEPLLTTTSLPPGPCNMHTADYIPHRQELLLWRGGDGREYLNQLHGLRTIKKEETGGVVFHWEPLVCSGTKPFPRANHSSALVKDGEMLAIFGGWDGRQRLNDMHLLDTRTLVWTAVAFTDLRQLPTPRAGMTFVSSSCSSNRNSRDDRIVLFGGSGPSGQCYDDVHVFDLTTDTWQQYQQDSSAIDQPNPTTSPVHSDLNNQPNQRSNQPHNYGNNEESNDNGEEGIGGHDTVTRRNEGGRLTRAPSRRAGHSCVRIRPNQLLIFGGSFGQEYLNDVFIFDTDPPPFIAKPTCHSVMHDFAAYVNNPQFHDIEFVFPGTNEIVYAHKLLLSHASERFATMFTNNCYVEATQRQITMQDIPYDTFLLMLQFLYTRQVRKFTCLDEAIELLKAADLFILQELKKHLEYELAQLVTSQTVEVILQAAEQYNASQLQATCYHHLRNCD